MVYNDFFKKFILFYNLDLKYKDYFSVQDNKVITSYLNRRKKYYYYLLNSLKELTPNYYNLLSYNIIKRKFSFNNKAIKKKPYSLIIYISLKNKAFKVNICTPKGLILKKFTSGLLGYKKSDRRAFFSLKTILIDVLDFLKTTPNSRILICTKGLSKNRNFIVNFFFKSKLRPKIKGLLDLNSLPFNGCRLPSAPRS